MSTNQLFNINLVRCPIENITTHLTEIFSILFEEGYTTQTIKSMEEWKEVASEFESHLKWVNKKYGKSGMVHVTEFSLLPMGIMAILVSHDTTRIKLPVNERFEEFKEITGVELGNDSFADMSVVTGDQIRASLSIITEQLATGLIDIRSDNHTLFVLKKLNSK